MTKINWLRRPVRVLGAAVMAGVLAAAVAPGAEAGAAPGGAARTVTSTARLSDGRPVNSAAAVKKVRAYWTAARMKAARPVPVAKAPAGRLLAGTAPTGKPGFSPPAKPTGNGDVKASLLESPVVGKVFFLNSKSEKRVCSASAVNSPSKQLVVTAAHCIHEGAGGTWVRNWMFKPKYYYGSEPYGTFVAKSFATFSSWITSSDKMRDIGFVTTAPNADGRKLVDAVGGNGLAWNQPKEVKVTVFGYPVDFHGGEIQRWCEGTTSDGGNYTITIGCKFNAGASGGPWMMNFDAGTGLGVLDGVTSTVDFLGYDNASYFDTAVQSAYNAQGTVT
ncbi:trypsin-like serine peptidase [Actinomadura rayongensis]|uniref:Trypsin-like serine protease n=1 Tax=Actinomadura rayongensis TaxID=1429076 RepID=A0A6I4WFN8_9ACTN|nr:trypsin-like serine protease [Actinomadura rayongensis]MXQ65402.1 trypsin-like serine protease [Actinomadura rayongensis]